MIPQYLQQVVRMNQEQIDAILNLGDLVEQLSKIVTKMDQRIGALERHVEQLRPRNEYDMTAQDAELYQRLMHTLKHPDCPWTGGGRCSWLEREFTSFKVMDWIPVLPHLIRRLDAIEYSLPKDIRADINAAMGLNGKSFEGTDRV
jgi:hypothetical protein